MEVLLDANPFSSVCGRICHHPCEVSCRRTAVDTAVALRQLKRFVMEQTKDYRSSRKRKVKPRRKEKVAVIGSGPAGLTAAHDLALEGFQVTVLERASTAGGMLGITIPRYRLPYSVLKEDIDDILALGVELRTGVEVGKDMTIPQLREQGFDAVVVAVGLSESRGLAVPGIDAGGVLLAMPFLRRVAAGERPVLGDRVVVIGGGNVAFDAARSARRLGVGSVTMVSLESFDEMPAWDYEKKEAQEEGVEIKDSWGPRSVSVEDGVVKGIELKRCTRVFDESGRFSPEFDEGQTSALEAGTIILAIGQHADLTSVIGSAVKKAGETRVEWDPDTMATSENGVFAAGEVVTGPGAAVEAVREGHRAAAAVMHYLDTGELEKQPVRELPALCELPAEVAEKVRKLERADVGLIPPEERVKSFSEIERALTEAEAMGEARRCMACLLGAEVDEDRCAGCLTCVRVCPFGVATVEKTASMPGEMCQACGLCAAECPAAGIALTRYGTDQMKERLDELLKGPGARKDKRPLIVSYGCLFATRSRALAQVDPGEVSRTGVLRVMVPCVGRLSLPDLLAPFEKGADGLVILSCAEGGCAYPTVEERLAGRVEHARELLRETGLEGERIQLYRTEGSAEESWQGFWESSRKKLEELAGNREAVAGS